MALVLLAEKDPKYCTSLQRELQSAGHEVITALSRKEALKRMTPARDYEVVVLDMEILREGDLDIISYVKQAQPLCEILIMTRIDDIEAAVKYYKRVMEK